MVKYLILTIVFLVSFSCSSVGRGYSKNEYQKTVTGLKIKRPYPVLREPYIVPILVDALKEDTPLVRFNAAHDLKALGPKARKALIPLIDCYNDVDFKVARMCYVASTKALGDPYIEPRTGNWFFSSGEKDPADNLAMYLNSGTTQQKTWSLNLLNYMNKSVKKIITPVISSLSDSSSDVRSAAQQVLIETKADIYHDLANSLDENKASISYILGKRGSKNAIDLIKPLVKDSNANVRLAAAQSLLLLGVNSVSYTHLTLPTILLV